MSKHINSSNKGRTFEREICKILAENFGGEYRRVPMSGGFMGGANRLRNKEVRQDAKDILSGDIICPDDFPFSVECKHHKEIRWTELNKYWIKIKEEANKMKRIPLLIYRENRKPIMVMSLGNINGKLLRMSTSLKLWIQTVEVD